MTTNQKARAKAGDTIKIIGFIPDFDGNIPETERKLIGTTWKVDFVDGAGNLHGAWGDIGILPEDEYVVVKST